MKTLDAGNMRFILKTIGETIGPLGAMKPYGRVKYNLSGNMAELEIAHDLLMQAVVVEVAVEPVGEA